VGGMLRARMKGLKDKSKELQLIRKGQGVKDSKGIVQECNGAQK